jgi:predicted AlkP superfamily phosphohydrolase/phosphomutase
MDKPMVKKRVIVIGIDGVPYTFLQDLSQNGTMPNFKKLADEGIFTQMDSSIPEISSVAWSSIITGVNPGIHGIFGFTDLAPDSYRMTFPNYSSLQVPAFWEQNADKRSVIINVPSTFPARELNGVLISGFVALDLKRSTYPPSLLPQLNELDYRVDVDVEKINQSTSFFLKDLDNTLKARIAAYRYLWENEDWDYFMLVFTGTDRLMHFLWNAYENNEHEHHSAFLDHYHQIDEAIGEIAEKANDNDTMILLSDHGFERLNNDVYVNYVLKNEGILKYESDQPSGMKDIDGTSRAFALDPGRIYIHLKDRFPKGCVEKSEREKIIQELEHIYSELEYNGQKIIRRCYRKEEIYSGPLMSQAPDLVLVGNSGFNLKGSLNPTSLCEKSIFTGMHNQHDAFLLVRGGSDKIMPAKKPCVTDIVEIINRS